MNYILYLEKQDSERCRCLATEEVKNATSLFPWRPWLCSLLHFRSSSMDAAYLTGQWWWWSVYLHYLHQVCRIVPMKVTWKQNWCWAETVTSQKIARATKLVHCDPLSRIFTQKVRVKRWQDGDPGLRVGASTAGSLVRSEGPECQGCQTAGWTDILCMFCVS